MPDTSEGGPTVSTADTGLPFTGLELVWLLLGGSVCLMLGLRLYAVTGRR